MQGAWRNAGAVNANGSEIVGVALSEAVGVGKRCRRAGELEGDDDGERWSYDASSGGYGASRRRSGARMQVPQRRRWRSLRAGRGGGFAMQFY